MPAANPAPASATELPHHTARLVAGYLVRRSQLIGTTTSVHDAWAPLPGLLGGPFATITFAQGRYGGRLGTERHLPPELAALPARTAVRWTAVHAWHEANYQHAYDLILRAYPEAASGRRSMGDISLTLA